MEGRWFHLCGGIRILTPFPTHQKRPIMTTKAPSAVEIAAPDALEAVDTLAQVEAALADFEHALALFPQLKERLWKSAPSKP